MTFSLRRKPRTTRPARSTSRRTPCSLLLAAAGLALAAPALGQDGKPASTFRPRGDAPTAQIIPVQAKGGPAIPPGTPPGTTPPAGSAPSSPSSPKTTPPGTPPGTAPGTAPGTTPPATPPGTAPGLPPGKGSDVPGTPGFPFPGGTPPVGGSGPGAGAGNTGSGLPGTGTRAGQDPYEAYIRLEPPGRERLFGSRDTERELEERMRQERRDSGVGDPIQFPEKPRLTEKEYQQRNFAPLVELAEPGVVVYRRLYFEEKNAERYGWDLGPIQPIVSTLAFFKDTLMFPHNFASYPCRRFDTNAGLCRPGDPVPYIVYPPEFTGSGLLAEIGAVALLFYAVP